MNKEVVPNQVVVAKKAVDKLVVDRNDAVICHASHCAPHGLPVAVYSLPAVLCYDEVRIWSDHLLDGMR